MDRAMTARTLFTNLCDEPLPIDLFVCPNFSPRFFVLLCFDADGWATAEGHLA